MKKSFAVSFYEEKDRIAWDRLVLRDGVNGLFIQTRRFIDYHPAGKFKDASICIRRGETLVGIILAAEVVENNEKIFFAHPGTTFGGLTVTRNTLKASEMNSILESVEEFLREHGFQKIFLKLVPDAYAREESELVDYLLAYRNYSSCSELNYVLEVTPDPLEKFSAEKRRDTRYSLQHGFRFLPINLDLGGGGGSRDIPPDSHAKPR